MEIPTESDSSSLGLLLEQLVPEPLDRFLHSGSERRLVVARSGYDLELVLDSRLGQSLLQSLRLLDRNDRVAVAVNDQGRWVLRVHERDRRELLGQSFHVASRALGVEP